MTFSGQFAKMDLSQIEIQGETDMDNIFLTDEPQQKKRFWESVRLFCRSNKTLLIIILLALLAVLLVIKIIDMKHDRAALSEEIRQAQEGMCYQFDYTGYNDDYRTVYCTEIWYFKDGKYSSLYAAYYDQDREVIEDFYSDLSDTSKDYTVEISLFGQPVLNGKKITVDEDMHILYYNSSKGAQISLEEAVALEKEYKREYTVENCWHEFGTAKVTKKATCTSKGEEKQVCKLCGYEEIAETPKTDHHYENKVCSVCGAKKEAERSDIKANSWYTYQDVLHFQNIELQNVFTVSNGKGMMVSYWFVCQHCHTVDDTLQMNVPQFNYDISKIFTCDECGKMTTVKLVLE